MGQATIPNNTLPIDQAGSLSRLFIPLCKNQKSIKRKRENPVFKEAVKLTLTPLLTSLTLLQYTDIDSESEMLGYGIGVILLNIGMYFVAPAVLIMAVRKRI